MTALSPFNLFLRCAAITTLLGAGSALAADPHHDDAHAAAKKPMALKPAHPKKTHHPAGKKAPNTAPKAAHEPAPTHSSSTPKAAKAATPKHPKAPPRNKSVKKPVMKATKTSKPGHAKHAPAPATKPAHIARKSHAAHWGYEGAGGPAHWGGIKQAFKACAAGRNQSPINIESAEAGHLAPLSVHYKVSLIEMVNNGHTVQANYGKGSYITLGAERYDLLQFHFHTPSEHRIAGRSFPMEIHFVHRNKRGQLAVVGVLATFGDYNLAAREIWDRLPARAHTKSAKTRALMNARDLLPDDTKYFRYSGSLTTPPCSEKVNWVVLQKPIHFSDAQIAKLHRIIGMNARPAQARNSRYLLQSIGG